METFRREIAGLCLPEKGDGDRTQSREMAVRLAALLARHYNRDVLDPMKLWDRVQTAMASAVSQDYGDPTTVVSAMLDHVKADGGKVGRDADVAAILAELEQSDSEAVWQYIRKAIYPILVFARQRWEQEKKERSGRLTIEDEVAARLDGRPPSKWFSEDQVQQLLADAQASKDTEDSEVNNA